ncbi:MAG: sigma-70 family RNA polymerase sigma factor [Acidobacteriaceae bacterium]|nr:sigma-70 family RNA polymerase sigma factor [Acidobacteriaceae bacterium]MBV9502717.1 sigma-70 family RNA polymerase sigma factor [Acidobacteriaceae bacterium]
MGRKHRRGLNGSAPIPGLSEVLEKSTNGDHESFDRLFTLIYNDFRGLAKSYLAHEAHPDTLQATALVNEAYLRLAEQQMDWKNRSHLLAVGAIAMRRILVNHAIAAKRQKRGGAAARVTLSEDLIGTEQNLDVLAVDEAIDALAKLDERHAKLVELRFFGGLNVPEVAGVLGVSVSTIEKDWRFCSAWLKNALRP